jgi:ubiquinone/menaquinone biosynthesis C-methylase UbiE
MYKDYYERKGAERNDLLANPEVLFQTLAFDRANITAFRKLRLDRQKVRILDVGCGSGAGILQFLRLGFDPSKLVGVDMDEGRISEARCLLPHVNFYCASADSMPFGDQSFDVVFESTMLGTLSSLPLLRSIAAEMIRVTKRGGFLVLSDWRYSKKGSGVKTAISRSQLNELFSIGSRTTFVAKEDGALIPPLGRRISKAAPALYFLFQRLFPLASGQLTTVLKRPLL